jgi:hypothetical protein
MGPENVNIMLDVFLLALSARANREVSGVEFHDACNLSQRENPNQLNVSTSCMFAMACITWSSCAEILTKKSPHAYKLRGYPKKECRQAAARNRKRKRKVPPGCCYTQAYNGEVASFLFSLFSSLIYFQDRKQ